MDLNYNSVPTINESNKPVVDCKTMMLGELIAQLDQPEMNTRVLTTLDPEIVESINERAGNLSMSPAEFSAGAVREFVDWADEEQWSQLMSSIREADDPGLRAVQTILFWVVSNQ